MSYLLRKGGRERERERKKKVSCEEAVRRQL
jgi:hypothetical protein